MPEPQPGELRGGVGPSGGPDSVIIDNRTGLDDAAVQHAIMAYWTETAGLQFGHPTTFQLYATNHGNMLSRSPFETPSNVIDEIKLARSVADTDDDIAGVIGQMVHTAYKDGMQNLHTDEPTRALFNEICKRSDMDHALKEMYREYLIASQFTTVQLFSRTRLNFTPGGTDKKVQAQVSCPLIGILPSESIRVTSVDIFGTGDLAYYTEDIALTKWLDEYFAPSTTPARKAAMQREQPVLAALFVGVIEPDWQYGDPFVMGAKMYKLNPRMAHRTTMPKGSTGYPRPRLTANFALLEAKRLLNIMDYSLLQGGTNYIVVAKQGSDQLPGKQPEIDNLMEQVRTASRTGVLVGDHRISIEIITPDLKELLNPAKRRLLGRKLAMMLMQVPEQATDDPGGEGMKAELTYMANTVTADRNDIKRHVERYTYDEVVNRNPATFSKGAPSLWHSPIILSGIKDFFDNVVKARDRGDIPRRWAVEVLGYDYDSAVALRKRELESGDDEVMTPGSVPFSSPNGADGGDGRPPGSSSNNGRPGGQTAPVDPAQRQRRRLVQRRRGEPTRAYWHAESAAVVRVGELTEAVISEYPEHSVGRVTEIEREAIEAGEVIQRGPVAVVPVNVGYDVTEVRAIRLTEGLSMIVGQRRDDSAVVARALCFREPHFTMADAEERAIRWGFVTRIEQEPSEAVAITESPPSPMQIIATMMSEGGPEFWGVVGNALGEAFARLAPQVTVVMPEEGERELIRDEETGAIIGVRRARA